MTIEVTSLRCVRLPELIALELYTGALRDRADAAELLARNPDADRAEIEAVCAAFGLDDALRELA